MERRDQEERCVEASTEGEGRPGNSKNKFKDNMQDGGNTKEVGFRATRLPRAMQKTLPHSCFPSHWSCPGVPQARSSVLSSSRCHGSKPALKCCTHILCTPPAPANGRGPSATQQHAHRGVDRIFAAFKGWRARRHHTLNAARETGLLEAWQAAWYLSTAAAVGGGAAPPDRAGLRWSFWR